MRLLAMASIALLTASLTACEASSPTAARDRTPATSAPARPVPSTDPRAIRRDAFNAMASIESVHVTGKVRLQGFGLATVEGSFTQHGACRMASTSRTHGAYVILRTTRGTWFRADQTFWDTYGGDAGRTMLGVIGDRWATDSSGRLTAEMAESRDLGRLLDQIQGDISLLPRVLSGASGEVVISYGSGKNQVELHVDAAQPHRILSATGVGQSLTFDRFDEPSGVKAPSRQHVIDLATLAPRA